MKCPNCKGCGQVYWYSDKISYHDTCSVCKGTGEIANRRKPLPEVKAVKESEVREILTHREDYVLDTIDKQVSELIKLGLPIEKGK